MTIKEIGMDQWRLMPPMPGTCPECAVKHDPAQPHNAQSLYYQMRFRQMHGRFPTWGDAMAHCSDEVKAVWKDALAAKGVPTEKLEPGGQ